ncbi:MAG: hypothetical protein ACXW2X_12255, partial [Thermoanaerobaculia bacterium]
MRMNIAIVVTIEPRAIRCVRSRAESVYNYRHFKCLAAVILAVSLQIIEVRQEETMAGLKTTRPFQQRFLDGFDRS